MHAYDILIANLKVLLCGTNLKVESEGEQLRVVQTTLGFINLPLVCTVIEEVGWDAWLEQFLQKVKMSVWEPDGQDRRADHDTSGDKPAVQSFQ